MSPNKIGRNDPAWTLEKFAETRANEAADMLGEKGPRVLRSVINVLGSTLPKERPAKGVLNDAIYQAAIPLLFVLLFVTLDDLHGKSIGISSMQAQPHAF